MGKGKKLAALVIVLALAIFAFFDDGVSIQDVQRANSIVEEYSEVSAPVVIETLPEPTQSTLTDPSPSSTKTDQGSDATKTLSPKKFTVVRVVDGDTVDVKADDGEAIRLRLIGVDTPETVHPSKPVECFGREASEFTKQLLGQSVRLMYDESQGRLDRYGRTLAYIILEDDRNFNQLLIADGYAHEYTYNIPYELQSTFIAAQKQAREKKMGLWGDGACE